MNDINVFNSSSLHVDFLDGLFEKNTDFPYKIDNSNFNLLYMLVDGIYPKTSRFVKTKGVPMDEREIKFSRWQEAARKDVERAFGVLVRRFIILDRGIEYWYLQDIKQMIASCLILHNMMVEARIETDIDIFDLGLPLQDNNNIQIGPTVTQQQNQAQENELVRREAVLEQQAQLNPDVVDLEVNRQRRRQRYFTQSMLDANWRYEALYNTQAHNFLTEAIMNKIGQL